MSNVNPRFNACLDFILDETGREIMVGDVLRFEHFTVPHGRGRKMHYMYKYVRRVRKLGIPPGKVRPFLEVSHLMRNFKESYWLLMNGSKLPGVRIVQGYGPKLSNGFGVSFEERPKREPAIKTTEQ